MSHRTTGYFAPAQWRSSPEEIRRIRQWPIALIWFACACAPLLLDLMDWLVSGKYAPTAQCRAVLRATPATLTGVRGRPTTACAMEVTPCPGSTNAHPLPRRRTVDDHGVQQSLGVPDHNRPPPHRFSAKTLGNIVSFRNILGATSWLLWAAVALNDGYCSPTSLGSPESPPGIYPQAAQMESFDLRLQSADLDTPS